MFRASSSTTSLVVCSTCRLSERARENEAGRRGGTLFAEELTAALAHHSCRGRLEIERMPRLFACGSHCTAYVRSDHRFGYILGRFSPTAAHAVALLDYIAQYLDTRDGVVPYTRWPQGIKGHFLVRVPPAGLLWQPLPDAPTSSP
jgi:predicted metal-binding protein